jgi:tRNA threonylcarbamoyl adenosine modification protein YeaZ
MLLALETATDRASVAVGRSEDVAVVTSVEGARRHAASLLPMLSAALDRAGARLGDLTAVVVSDGPGSFTGLRVGAAVAKALVQARGLALWTAPSLLVRAAGTGCREGLVLAVSDALRGEVYAAAYRFGGGAIVSELVPGVWRPEELTLRVPLPSVIVGDVPPVARAALERWSGRVVVPSPEGAPDARRLLGLVGRIGGAREVTAAGDWEPQYGRPAEAQARWESTHGRRLPDSTGSPR